VCVCLLCESVFAFIFASFCSSDMFKCVSGERERECVCVCCVRVCLLSFSHHFVRLTCSNVYRVSERESVCVCLLCESVFAFIFASFCSSDMFKYVSRDEMGVATLSLRLISALCSTGMCRKTDSLERYPRSCHGSRHCWN